MLEIDYKFTDRLNSLSDDILKKADDIDFGYKLFAGDIVLKSNHVDFSTSWGWVPLIDFLSCVNGIIENLKNGSSEQFEFTESEATLNFKRVEDIVHVTASYADGLMEVSYDELVSGASVALAKLRADLSEKYPVLLNNTAFNKMTKPKKQA